MLDRVLKPGWAALGLCWEDRRIQNLMFSHKLDQQAAAKMLCRQCPVVEQCLEFGLYESDGIWGGRDEQERRAIRKRRERQGESPSLSIRCYSGS